MGTFRTLLNARANASDPFFLILALLAVAGFVVIFMTKPRAYVPLLLATAALPKFFTLTRYSDLDFTGAAVTGASGFSLVDLILAAAVIVLLLRRRRTLPSPEARAFARANVWWGGSVAFSVVVGLLLWSGTYPPSKIIYAVRYLLTLASFVVAAQYGGYHVSEKSLRKMLYRLAVLGNVIVVLGIVYYFLIGSTAGGAKAEALIDQLDSSLFRSTLWFFDYGNDMGFFAALIGVLDIILLLDRRLRKQRPLTSAGLLACVVAILLIGERANIIVLSSAILYLFQAMANARQRSVRAGVLFQIACLAGVAVAVLGTVYVVAPEALGKKVQETINQDSAAQAAGFGRMKEVGVPDAIASTVSSLPFGDWAFRLSLNVAGLWFFLNHPMGVGFWGQLAALGFWSHHEFITIAIEQGFLGVGVVIMFLTRLYRLLWSTKNMPGVFGQFSLLMRSISVGLCVAMVMANTVLLDMKFMLVYWTLVGVWSVIPRGVRTMNAAPVLPAPMAQRELVRV